MPAKTKDQLAALTGLSQTVAAKLIGMKRETLKSTDAPRQPDGLYDAVALVAWAIERERLKASSDPMLAGGDSPNLERYRAAKAELAEMDAAARRGELVEIDEILSWWQTEIAPGVKQAIEAVERMHPESAKLITAAIERADTAVDQRQTNPL
jgi:hypothetical protein